jgi:hypothetical protein
MKGMHEILTWRILGTSLQRTPRADRSDPTVASAHSRRSSQVCSSRSSSRTRTGSEAPRVQNRSLSLRRSLGPRHARVRSPPLGRAAVLRHLPPRRQHLLQLAHRVPPRPRRQVSDRRPRVAATDGSTARAATTSAGAAASTSDTSGGPEAAAAPVVSLGTTAASTEDSASGARPTTTCVA